MQTTYNSAASLSYNHWNLIYFFRFQVLLYFGRSNLKSQQKTLPSGSVMNTALISVIPLLLFALASSDDPAIRPKVYLYAETLSTEYLGSDFQSLPDINAFTLLHEDNDMTGDTLLISALNASKAYCVDGVWRFYPEKDFLAPPGNDGFTLGLGQHRFCENAGTVAGEDLALMKSYRYLGPVDWETEYSMTVYEGLNFAGRNITVVTTLQAVPETNTVDIDFEVQSLVITAPNNTADPTENQNRKLCSSWLINILDNPSFNFNVCYNLCSCPNAPAGDLPKMFMLGSNVDHAVNYLRFAQYDDASGNGAECDGVIPPPTSAVMAIVPPPTTPCA